MMKIIKIICSGLLVFSSIFAGGGSVYSRYGLGDVYFGTSARISAMGGLGLSLSDKNYINNLNPAGWNRINLTRIESGISLSANKLKDESSKSVYNDFNFNGFSIILPLQRDYGITLAGGMMPVTNVQYNITTNVTEGDENYNLTYKGSGGLSKLFLGLSYRHATDISFGASFEFYTGKNEYTSGIYFQNSSQNYNSEYVTTCNFKGIGWNFGIISNDLSKLIDQQFISDLRIGLTYNYVGKLDTDILNISNTIVYSEILGDTTSSGRYDTNIPESFGTGLSFKLDENYLFTFDYLTQFWKNLNFAGNEATGLRNLQKIGIGFEYNRHASQFDSFWEQMIFRCGLSFENTQYRINGKDIKQIVGGGGFSIPMGAQSYLDFGFQYGRRGTATSGLLKEDFFKADISFSFGDLWFIRTER